MKKKQQQQQQNKQTNKTKTSGKTFVDLYLLGVVWLYVPFHVVNMIHYLPVFCAVHVYVTGQNYTSVNSTCSQPD